MARSFSQIVLLTGATDGIGRLMARQLAQRSGLRLLVHGRDTAKGAQLLEELAASPAQVSYHNADFADMAQVRALAEEVAQTTTQLTILINNAALLRASREETAQGLELQHAVNMYAPYLLAELCKPMMQAGARVVHVTSAASEGDFNFADPNFVRAYHVHEAYTSSKVGLTMLGALQAERWRDDGVRVNMVNPLSLMDTPMVAYFAKAMPSLPTGRSDPAVGARNVLAAALDYGDATGMYFDGDMLAEGHGEGWCRDVPVAASYSKTQWRQLEAHVRSVLELL